MRVNGASMAAPPPMRLEVTYAVTAWTKAVEDEHRLLSQVLAILFSHTSLPADLLAGRLASASQLRAIETEVGRPKEEKADFWTSIGGRYKASIDYAVRIEVESGLMFTRGPEVRTQTMRLELDGGPPHDGGAPALRRRRARLETASRSPTRGSRCPTSGSMASSDREGRFLFDGMRPGDHKVAARTAAGRRGERSGQGAGRGRRPGVGRSPAPVAVEARMTSRAIQVCPNGCPQSSIAWSGGSAMVGPWITTTRRGCCWEISRRSWSSAWPASSPRTVPT